MFNQQLFEARLGKRWSPEEASQKVGVSEKTYRRWEAGTNIPQTKTFGLLLIAFSEKSGKPAKPEDLGYILENGCIRLKTLEEVRSPTQVEVAVRPKDDLVQTHEDMLESAKRSRAPLQETTSKQEEAFASFESDTDVITFVPRPESSPASLDLAMWLWDRANKVRTVGTSRPPILQLTTIDTSRLPIQRLAAICTEIESWDRMIDEDHPQRKEFLSTRRMVLAGLLLISDSILPWVRSGQMTPFITREFLDQCATSIVSCDYLLKGDGHKAVEYALSQYLDQLISLAKSPSPFQQEAAYLAAQGCCLRGLINHHQRQFRVRVTNCKQGVELAKQTGDSVLISMALKHLGDAWNWFGRPDKYLEAYQEAEGLLPKELDRFPLRLRHCIYGGVSNAYARLGKVQEALHYLGLASQVPFPLEDDSVIPAMRYDLSFKIATEGRIHENLGKVKAHNGPRSEAHSHWKDADTALSQELSASAGITEDLRVQINNQRTAVALQLGQMDNCINYLKQGVRGAEALGSEELKHEARVNWRAMKKRWPYEGEVEKLDEALDL